MNRTAAALCVLMGLTGCATGNWYAKQSVGRVGCSEREMRITNEDTDAMAGTVTWTAWCGQQAYNCQSQQGGALYDTGERGTHCAAAIATSGGASPQAPKPSPSPVPQGISSSRDPTTRIEHVQVVIGSRYLRVALDGEPGRDPGHVRLSLARALQGSEVLQGCPTVSLDVDGVDQPLNANPSHTLFSGDGGTNWESMALTLDRPQAQPFERSSNVAVRACQFALRLNGYQTNLIRAFLKRWDSTPRDPNAPPVVEPAAAPAADTAPTEPTPTAAAQLPDAAPAGCQYDMQCKGDRLCVEGRCVDPPPKSTGGAGKK